MSNAAKKPVCVGVIGLGRSGWQYHTLMLETMPGLYQVVAVTDPDATRCQEAKERLGCRTYESISQLLADPEVELAVVATPNMMHGPHAVQALSAGKHVVVEKPMAADVHQADEMIEAARKAGKILTVFQSLRYIPSFVKVREVIASGKLGRIVEIKIRNHGFARRWDWQTLKEFNGGELNNTSPHFLDMMLQLFGPTEPEVFCHLERTLTSGDAEDHVRVIIKAMNSPMIDLEIARSVAYPQPRWQVIGTNGGLVGDGNKLSWKYVDFSLMPSRPASKTPTPDRSYNSENYEWTEEEWKDQSDYNNIFKLFYLDLYRTLRENAPLAITPESVRRQITLIEKCRMLCPNV
jgi:scyllo-inositol 2-dehydrogenase (NADP+)